MKEVEERTKRNRGEDKKKKKKTEGKREK